MSELSLEDEIHALAQELAAAPDEVVDLAADAAQVYRRERFIALGLAAVDAMVKDGPEVIDQNEPRLVAARERLRDRLKALLAWAKATERM